jgi:hypothetical protein
MTVRTYIYDLITNDSVLNALGIDEDSTFTTHTIDTPAVRPLCILRWQATNPGISSDDPSPVNQRILTVWVHDDRNRGNTIASTRLLNVSGRFWRTSSG